MIHMVADEAWVGSTEVMTNGLTRTGQYLSNDRRARVSTTAMPLLWGGVPQVPERVSDETRGAGQVVVHAFRRGPGMRRSAYRHQRALDRDDCL